MTLSATLSEVTGSGGEEDASTESETLKNIGIEGSSITQELRKTYNIKSREGIVVTSVEQNSARPARIREGCHPGGQRSESFGSGAHRRRFREKELRGSSASSG
jgi:hypothetical protein